MSIGDRNNKKFKVNSHRGLFFTCLISLGFVCPAMASSGSYPGALNKTSPGKYTLRLDPAKHGDKIVEFVTLPKGISWVKEKKLKYSGQFLTKTFSEDQAVAWTKEFCGLRSLKVASLKIAKKNVKKNTFTFTCR